MRIQNSGSRPSSKPFEPTVGTDMVVKIQRFREQDRVRVRRVLTSTHNQSGSFTVSRVLTSTQNQSCAFTVSESSYIYSQPKCHFRCDRTDFTLDGFTGSTKNFPERGYGLTWPSPQGSCAYGIPAMPLRQKFPKEVTAYPGLLHKGAALTGYRLCLLGEGLPS
jgi:hypothetical protein